MDVENSWIVQVMIRMNEDPRCVLLKAYPAFAAYIWERLEEEHKQPLTAVDVCNLMKGIPTSILRILESDFRDCSLTPILTRRVQTAWSEIEDRFVQT